MESTTESHTAISNTFQDGIKEQNPYQSKSRSGSPEPTPASFLFPVHNASYLSGTVKAIC